MRIRGLTLWLGLLGVGLVSCGSSTHGLTVSWTFANGGSCQGAGIDQVRITIPGESLQTSIFDCSVGQVLFSDFYPGTYQVTVDALDGNIPSPPTPLWTGTTSVDLREDVQARVVLQPVSQQNAVTYLSWTLDPATGDANQIPQCGAGQRLDSVAIFIDNQNMGSYGCDQGVGKVVISPYVAPGQHQVDLVAYNAQENTTSFAESGPLQITFSTGQAQSQNVPLHWNVGGLQIGWAPYASQATYPNTPQSCGDAGIADLVLGFFAQAPGQTFSLGSACNASVVLDNVYSGTWTPYIDACGPGGTPGLCGLQGGATPIYQENPNLVSPPTVSVQAGKFFQANNAAAFQVFIPLFPVH
jgi:hypothetical protein